MTEQAKAVVPFIEGKGLVPNDFDGMYRMASVMAASGLMPQGLDRPESAFIALQLGFELGMTPMQAAQNIAVINKRPVVWGDTMLALVQASGLLDDIDEREVGEGDNLRYECIVRRKGREKPIARSFSITRAKAAGLMSKDSWRKYPERMCQMRARSWALRDGFPDVLKGIRSPADVDDADMVDVTPAEKPVQKTNATAEKPDYGSEPQQAAGTIEENGAGEEDGEDTSANPTEENPPPAPEPEKVPCRYCGKMCKPGMGLARHENRCTEKEKPVDPATICTGCGREIAPAAPIHTYSGVEGRYCLHCHTDGKFDPEKKEGPKEYIGGVPSYTARNSEQFKREAPPQGQDAASEPKKTMEDVERESRQTLKQWKESSPNHFGFVASEMGHPIDVDIDKLDVLTCDTMIEAVAKRFQQFTR
jgi:hypothetical protein